MTFPVNESVVQNPWISSAASAATYTKTNAATGAEICPSVLSRGRRPVDRDRARRAGARAVQEAEGGARGGDLSERLEPRSAPREPRQGTEGAPGGSALLDPCG